MAFMAAGNDSTSLFTNMVLYYLCEHPEVEARLRSEVDARIPTEQLLTFSNLRDIKYLEWVQL
jgi:cytochrome P450